LGRCPQAKADVPADQPEPGAVVIDRQQHLVTSAAQFDDHLPLRARRPDGVAQQVGDHAAHFERTREDAQVAPAQLKAEIPSVRGLGRGDRVCGNPGEIVGLSVRVPGTVRLEQVLEQVTEPLRLFSDPSQASPDDRRGRIVDQSGVGQHEDARDRLAHVVAYLMESVNVRCGRYGIKEAQATRHYLVFARCGGHRRRFWARLEREVERASGQGSIPPITEQS